MIEKGKRALLYWDYVSRSTRAVKLLLVGVVGLPMLVRAQFVLLRHGRVVYMTRRTLIMTL